MNSSPILLRSGFLAVVFLSASLVPAQEPVDGIAILERRIDARQKRIAELSEELISLDNRIESRVEQVIELFKSVDDSKETRTRIARLKGEVLDGLRKNAELYAEKRRAIRAELDDARNRVPHDLVKSDLAAFDERILKRLSQAVEIGESFAPAEEHEKYIVVYKDDRWGRGDDKSYRKNEDFEQNRRVQTRVRAEERELLEGINQAIDYLNNKNRQLTADLDRADIPEDRKERMREDIARNEKLLGNLRESRGDIEEAPGTTGREVGQSEANDIAEYLHDLRDDLRADQVKLFALYNELNGERGELAGLLAARDKVEGSNQPDDPQ